ncbi:MAG: major capsid protein [Proteobacteria bacterium]|nr:major capsid protein [Pseudomonadota bacterium]
MDLIVNPFDTGGYNLATMTQAVNILPNNYGLVRSMGLFVPEPVRTRTIIVEEQNGLLSLLQTQPNGAPAPKARHAKGKMRSFVIPHIPYEDQIFPDDIQGVRQVGSGSDAEVLQNVMMSRLTQMRSSHAITEEHLMCGAVKGTILDADGSTIYNLFTEFGIAQQAVTFALDTATTDVSAKCRQVVRLIEDNLLGDVMTGVHCLCGETFFDSLIGHENVEKFFVNHAKAIELAGGGQDPRKGFSFGGITFAEYRGKATDPATGSARAFIGATDAHFFPVGTQNSFKIHYAPANHMETVNTFGQPIYAMQTMDPKGRWVDINTESNPLPLCRRPGLLIKGNRV